jgi:hypothetical protein
MGILIKLSCTLLLLVISSKVDGRSYQNYRDDNDMRDVRRASSQQSQSNFPAFPGDEDQENNIDDTQEQDRNRYELEQQQQQQNKPRPNNYSSGNQQNQNGKEFDETQVVEYVTQKVEDKNKTPPTVVEINEPVVTTEKHVPWYKKVSNFAKKTYHGLAKKIRGERSSYAEY